MERGFADGDTGHLPWAGVFDPAANFKALNAVQAEGFRAASALVDRLIEIATKGTTGDQPKASAAPRTKEELSDILGATDVEPLVRSWWSTMGPVLFGAGGTAAARADEQGLDLAKQSVRGRLELSTAAPGVVSAEVWLHNRSIEDFGDVELRCSELLGHHGDLIRSDEVLVSPDVVSMPPRSSRGVVVEIHVTPGMRPGTYRGNMVASGHAGLWLPVELTVVAVAP